MEPGIVAFLQLSNSEEPAKYLNWFRSATDNYKPSNWYFTHFLIHTQEYLTVRM